MLGLILVASLYSEAPPTFPTGIELVRIDVAVVDRRGRPVVDLASSDFELHEEKRRIDVITFEAVHLPTEPVGHTDRPGTISTPQVPSPTDGQCYTIFVDDTHISSQTAAWVRSELARFLAEDVRGGEWVTLVAPESGVFWTARNPDERSHLLQLAGRLSGQFVRNPFAEDSSAPADYEAMRAVEYGSRTGASAASRGASEYAAGNAGDRRMMLYEAQYATAQRRIRSSIAALTRTIAAMEGIRGRKTLCCPKASFVLRASNASMRTSLNVLGARASASTSSIRRVCWASQSRVKVPA